MPKYDKSFLDWEYRRIFKTLLNSAKKEIIIITDEFYAYEKFLDMQMALYEAIDKGVHIKMLMKKLSEHIKNKLIYMGCEVYLTPDAKLKNHCMVVDDDISMIWFTPKRNCIGNKTGEYHMNSTAIANNIKHEFKELTRNTKKEKFDKELDPLKEFISNPIDLGYETDSSQIDGELY